MFTVNVGLITLKYKVPKVELVLSVHSYRTSGNIGEKLNFAVWRFRKWLYKSLIHPHLQYASAVRCPCLAMDIKIIEHVQKFALRLCTKDWIANYESLLLQCNLNSTDVRHTFKTCLCSWRTTKQTAVFCCSYESNYVLRTVISITGRK